MHPLMEKMSLSSSDTSFEHATLENLDENFNPLIPEREDEKPLSVAELKMRYMRNYLLSKKDKYCQERCLSTTCVTWNVNGREPQEDLTLMLPDDPSDIFVLGLQEIDRRPEAYMYNVSVREKIWVDSLENALKEKYSEVEYGRVGSKVLVGLLIVVLVKKDHFPHIGRVSESSASCGIMGIVGNKGAVGIRFKIYNDYVCFVNCHLAAHTNQVLRRNQDFEDLHKRLIFPVTHNRTKRSSRRHEAFTDAYWEAKGFVGVGHCDFLVWLGDFNYRVEMEGQLARIFVQHGQIDSVLENDQMKREKERGQEYLIRYSEAEITFLPSYSFDAGSDNYDSSEKQRVPSWCDRILWRSSDRIESKLYDCLFEFKSSDHKPVRFGSILRANELVPELYESHYLDSLKQLDVFENAAIPDTEVSKNSIDAGLIAYHHMVQESFKLINRGRVMAQYRFLFDKDRATPSWLRIEPVQGLIAPGQAEDIKIFFVYDNSVATSDESQKDHILVLHIEGGRDHFICVNFTCRATSFGKPLESLKMHRVLLDRKEPKLLFKVPTVLWRLVDYVIDQSGALKAPNLFLLSGTEHFNNLIQNCLDLHEPFPEEINCEVGYHSIAESILRFFNALPDTLIPSILFQECLAASRTPEATIKALNELPETNFMVFEYFLRFVRDILLPQNQSVSRLALAQVLGMSLLKPQNGHKITKKEGKDVTQFFLNLIK